MMHKVINNKTVCHVSLSASTDQSAVCIPISQQPGILTYFYAPITNYDGVSTEIFLHLYHAECQWGV